MNHALVGRRRPHQTSSPSSFTGLQWDLLGTGVQGSWVSKPAHLRSNSLFIIDVLMTPRRSISPWSLQALLCQLITSSAAQGRGKIPLLPELKVHCYKIHEETLQTLKSLYWSSRICFALEYFRTCLFWGGTHGKWQ